MACAALACAAGPKSALWRDFAEDIGFDSLWVVDHLLYRLEGEEQPRGVWESWPFLSALAAITRRVELGTLVLAMGWRNPALLAKMADTVDDLLTLAQDLGGGMEYCHGVGLKLAHLMGRELGEAGMETLRRLKSALDPAGVLNPGKMGL
jgi:FAD/FMN-containing dehydrogenase